MPKPEVYVSIDVETDGPAPGLNSMLALGAVALSPDTWEQETPVWYATLEPLPGASQHPDTMAWWQTQPEAWEEVQQNQWNDLDSAINHFVAWVDRLPGKPIAVALPAASNFAFVNYYCHWFAGRNPLGFSCLDIESYASGIAGQGGTISGRETRALAGKVNITGLHAHNALDDATWQGRLFMQLRQYAARLGVRTS